jgi:hypothetical protein
MEAEHGNPDGVCVETGLEGILRVRATQEANRKGGTSPQRDRMAHEAKAGDRKAAGTARECRAYPTRQGRGE